jgi:hypothetical protein
VKDVNTCKAEILYLKKRILIGVKSNLSRARSLGRC